MAGSNSRAGRATPTTLDAGGVAARWNGVK